MNPRHGLPADDRGDETLTVARNVSTRYMAIALEALLGLVVLPYNVSHLGPAAYGLWVLTGSVTAYFSVLDLGYSGALVKFVAQYRAKRDERALNEILSTTFLLFAVFGVVTYLAAVIIALFLGRLFHLSPEQVETGRIVLLIVSLNVAAGTACSVFGAVINGFQRYDLNNTVGAISSAITAAVNVAVLAAGYGLIPLVIATTSVRLLTYVVYRANAYRVFPALSIRFGSFRRDRLRELTSFSVYMLLIDWANKLNYSIDAVVIGAFLGTTAVAVWTVGQRVAEVTQRLANQLNEVLFPTVVDNDAAARTRRLQTIFVQGTRLSLAAVIPLGGAVMLMASPLVRAWVGPEFDGSVVVVQLLTLTVIVRVGAATAGTLLKGAGEHRLVAFTNVAAAFVNASLSLALVSSSGLVGVALATLGPVAAASTLVLFPAGCRRVGLSIGRGIAEAVWPAIWPAAVMVGFVFATRDMAASNLAAVAAQIAVACLVYATTFILLALRPEHRRFYISKAMALLRRPTGPTLDRVAAPATISEGA
jgi:O-antigen/teichoic acid export membrane protein